MTADRLLRLYPRAWRERYGEEFLEFVGPGRLRPQQVIDIVSGAVDAHLSREVRRSTAPEGGGAFMLTSLKAACARTGPRITTRDGVIGAAVMIVASLVFVALGTVLKRQGLGIGQRGRHQPVLFSLAVAGDAVPVAEGQVVEGAGVLRRRADARAHRHRLPVDENLTAG